MQSRTQFLFPLLTPRYPTQCARVFRSRVASRFHTSARLYQNDNNFPNHYETLELKPNATVADIKRQFYHLSKLHHPDLARSHPSPTTTSDAAPSPSPTRFHQISEAYRVLAHPDSRQRYDRDYHRVFSSPTHPRSHTHHHHTPHGSHSSHSSHAGSRPASGLSRRRAQFRGPPPSFYQQGRYGAGTAGAGRAARAQEEAQRAASGEGDAAGGVDSEVPHFDKEGHRRRQEGVASTQRRSRRARGEGMKVGVLEREGDAVFNFLLVGGIVVLIAAVPVFLAPGGKRREERGKEGKG